MMENNIKVDQKMTDENMFTVIVLKYKIYRNDSGKIFGRLLVLKHRVENFLKEAFNEDILFQNPNLQNTRDSLVELIQGLTYLCSGIPPRETITIPELNCDNSKQSYRMKFVKGNLSNFWLCYTDNDEFLYFLKNLREKYDDNKLEQFIFYPRLGEYVYFKQGINIYRGIVQEYIIPENSETEEEVYVDLKVLNIDNSEVVEVPLNYLFKMDKDGSKIPMQCVLCTIEDVNKNLIIHQKIPTSGFSVSLLKKYKLDVVFHHRKICANGLSSELQCITLYVSPDKIKDKKNNFNVNSKEFVPRNNASNGARIDTSCINNQLDDEQVSHVARSSLLSSSQVFNGVPRKTIYVNKNSYEVTSTKVESKPHFSDMQNETKSDSKSVVNETLKRDKSPAQILTNQNISKNNGLIDKNSKFDKNSKSISVNIIDKLKYTNISTANESSNFVNRKSNFIAVSSPAFYSHPSSQIHSSSIQLPNVPPYMLQSVPPFPPNPIHFPGQFFPYSTTTQPVNSAFQIPQYPYSTYVPTPPPINHSQQYIPPSTPYQSYIQPIGPISVPYFTSQPPFPQQFYQAPPPLSSPYGSGSNQYMSPTSNVTCKIDPRTEKHYSTAIDLYKMI